MTPWLLIPAFIVGSWVGFALCALCVASSKPTPKPTRLGTARADGWRAVELDEGVELLGNPMARMDAAARRRRR